ncbi:MAG TPA: 4-(cytidine 5'-diphospho)-2-C-methyl-D-erythritol kinase [Burkholderiales bacterium]|nr:4-(cytidine 5'-diphospho)-2-C-methyl-D-erythritol kinase [Burkholderiales bacterium]
MEVTAFPAPGKLNLFLHVLGRRPDGYHEVQTVFRLVERADCVGIALREDGAVNFSGAFGEANLCVRAAKLLKAETGCQLGCELTLEKRLPVGGGMGGGSSDAATVLVVLNRMWKLGLPKQALLELGARLGADVPFFIFGRNAIGEGVGERLSALDLPPAWYLVLTPQVEVSTKEIFADASLTRDTKRLKIPPFLSGQGRNDLQAVAAAKYPDVRAHLDWLEARAPGSRMTGSGACVFAEFRTEAEALALQSELPAGLHGFVTRGLERHPLHDWAG